jgi:1-deoxy-D-xylulose-5-phosphate synthase
MPGDMNKDLIVILNDNDMSIAPPVGAMSHYFARQVSSKSYNSIRKLGKGVAEALGVKEHARRAEEYLRGMAVGGTLFEEMGFRYVGPIDGHDMDQLVAVLRNVRDAGDGPILIHAITQKGKGYAEHRPDRGHATAKFDVAPASSRKSPQRTELHQGLRQRADPAGRIR